ncbi:hypothetical protein [Spirosoma sordidisoli]|uniref:Uncharacterized protein n=1 Tax=Spirosoma sordidisoli TaxID=2502893 RepID=A0A4V1RVI4_9BACT|nr:hypothetical protein [Spirosoma sordidisoli]RYC66878.1 hypothetical protein EQG79_27640 [Spirosoma sordidisoli]
MKAQLVFIACLLIALVGTTTVAQDKPDKNVTVTGKAVPKTRGANPNIKKDVPTTDVPVPRPAKTRGALCRVKFDNYTGLYIKIYVDGDYKGTLAPWDDGTVTVGSGYTTIYCVSTGGTREWSASGDCRENYVYTLR